MTGCMVSTKKARHEVPKKANFYSKKPGSDLESPKRTRKTKPNLLSRKCNRTHALQKQGP